MFTATFNFQNKRGDTNHLFNTILKAYLPWQFTPENQSTYVKVSANGFGCLFLVYPDVLYLDSRVDLLVMCVSYDLLNNKFFYSIEP